MLSEQVHMRADGFYHPFIPTPGPLRYRAISPDTASSYVGADDRPDVPAPMT